MGSNDPKLGGIQLNPEMVALAHHWLVGMRGGEKVLEQFHLLFPAAPIHTVIANPINISEELRSHSIIQSPLARIPQAARWYKSLLPLFPLVTRSLQVKSSPALLLTSDASVVKGLSYDALTTHVCYCHSPPRYLWGMEEDYLEHASGLKGIGRLVFRAVGPYVRRFDYEAAQRVNHFVANSRFVQERIRRFYGRDSTVIHPPVSVADFRHDRSREDFYLIVSELVPYKRIDLAIEAFNRLDRKLVIIGSGPELATLQARAKANIVFLGRQPFPAVREHLERCRAFIFPGIEDFGIAPLEAQAAGGPVVAYGAGGVLETVIEGTTGMFFSEQTSAALTDAVSAFERRLEAFNPDACRLNATRFSPEHFRAEIKTFLVDKMPGLFREYKWPV